MISQNKPISAQEYLNALGNLNERRNKRMLIMIDDDRIVNLDFVVNIERVTEDTDIRTFSIPPGQSGTVIYTTVETCKYMFVSDDNGGLELFNALCHYTKRQTKTWAIKMGYHSEEQHDNTKE